MDDCRIEHEPLSSLIKHMFVLTQQRIDIFGQLGAFVVGNSAAGEVGCAAHADGVAHEHHAMLEPRSSGAVCFPSARHEVDFGVVPSQSVCQ